MGAADLVQLRVRSYVAAAQWNLHITYVLNSANATTVIIPREWIDRIVEVEHITPLPYLSFVVVLAKASSAR